MCKSNKIVENKSNQNQLQTKATENRNGKEEWR